ncbi:Serine/threonine-protein phosphatase 4 regulatory subunit 1 [Apophysomyces ossiformis]|uniref:Serine/threonine-protein phosphatase 4 regulatory subunit 1 n=1 Tax=Apophysomyces ossiformis TaxID=679940 RepID=A0A8H7ENJ6_9FUNG|nr:Serine/threonine-protein phosphatase 4 regulatory subunit 1 [Apophysomyces ossiformis]
MERIRDLGFDFSIDEEEYDQDSEKFFSAQPLDSEPLHVDYVAVHQSKDGTHVNAESDMEAIVETVVRDLQSCHVPPQTDNTQEREPLYTGATHPYEAIRTPIDNITDPLDKLDLLSTNDLTVQRLLFVKDLANTLQEMTMEDALKKVFPIVQKLAADPDDTVRETFVSELDKIILYFYMNAPPLLDEDEIAKDSEVDPSTTTPETKGLHIPRHAFAPLLIECLLDQNSVLAGLGQQCLVSIATTLQTDFGDLGQKLLDSEIFEGVVMGLMAVVNGQHRSLSPPTEQINTLKESIRRPSVPGFEIRQADPEEDQEDANLAKMICLSIVSALAEAFGPERCVSHCLSIIEQMADDSMFYVRKEAAAAVGSIAMVVNSSVAEEKLLPLYHAFMNDTVWHVRKACALSLPQICSALVPEQKSRIAVEGIERFNNDVSRNVRDTLDDIIGELIAKFLPDDWETTRQPGKVPEALLEFFLSLSRNEGIRIKSDVGQVMTCAYNFPAVVLTAGVDYWDSCLKDTYLELTKDHQARVRATFARSLHEIARIIGPERTERDLVQIFALYLMDLDQVKKGVLNHLADFLAALATETRNEYIPILAEVWDGVATSWRLRDILVVQLRQICTLFDASRVVEHILPLAVRACQDGFAAVRENGVAMFPVILQIVKNEVDRDPDDMEALALLSQVTEGLDAFARANSYRERLIFAHICEVLLEAGITGEDFARFFLPRICILAEDNVVNVRISVARTLRTVCLNDTDGQDYCSLERSLYFLAADKDEDVRTPVLDFVDASAVEQQHLPARRLSLSPAVQVEETHD